jgi:hypothetical protein
MNTYLEINQLIALNYVLLYFSFTMAPTWLYSTPVCRFRHTSCGTFIANIPAVTYILPQHDLALLSLIMLFFLIHILYCHSPCIYLLYDFIVFRLYPTILTEVAQKETESLPEDVIVLPKHVGALV